jgi:DnaJ-class molecular chaperone
MIAKCLNKPVMAARQFGSSAVHSRVPVEKEYYSILGIEQTATPEQIKEAYRQMVKLHHPDVAGSASPDASKFRDITEAFSVLSVRESRVNYDLLRKKNPDAFREVSEAEFIKERRADLRDASGNTPIAKPTGYAEERLAELKAQRKMYNVNNLGYYMGGLP